jgi:hypothetical protein
MATGGSQSAARTQQAPDVQQIILDEIRGIRKDMDIVKEGIIRNEEWHETLGKQLECVDQVVYGNGKPGLRAELDALSDRLEPLERDYRERTAVQDDTQKQLRNLKWGTISAVILLLINWIWNYLIHLRP